MLVPYDTETTGLWKNGLSISHELQPKICSISALLIDETSDHTFEIIDSMDCIVKPDGWVIPPQILPAGMTCDEAKAQKIPFNSSDVHGITHEQAMDEGIPLFDAMKRFNDLVVRADGLLGHNEAYDNNVIKHALKLLKRTIPLPERRVCTMMMAKDYCRLPPNFPGGDWKWPKLSEAYLHVFGREMVNAHSSLADITQSVELYQELKRRGVPDAVPAKDRKGMKLKDWEELGWPRQRLEDLIALKHTNNPGLNEWDFKFLTSLDQRLSEFGDNVYLSEKQIDIFKKIEEKAV